MSVDVSNVMGVGEYFGIGKDEYLQVLKPAYGSIHAPRMWWQRVKKDLAAMGVTAMEIEPCLWGLYDQDRRLLGQVLVHVDDFLFAGNDDHPSWKNFLEDIKSRYEWGEWHTTDSVMQCGVLISEVP